MACFCVLSLKTFPTDSKKHSMKTVPTLYEWLGGNEKLEQLTELFYGKVLQDDLLGEVFRRMSAEHPQHVAHFIGEVFGGRKGIPNPTRVVMPG